MPGLQPPTTRNTLSNIGLWVRLEIPAVRALFDMADVVQAADPDPGIRCVRDLRTEGEGIGAVARMPWLVVFEHADLGGGQVHDLAGQRGLAAIGPMALAVPAPPRRSERRSGMEPAQPGERAALVPGGRFEPCWQSRRGDRLRSSAGGGREATGGGMAGAACADRLARCGRVHFVV